jgi:hypothetical protein
MKLALRHALPADAPRAARFGAAVIRTRLVSAYAHGAIVIGDTLYHSNAQRGVHAEPFVDDGGWLLVDLGTEHDARALALFALVEGAAYDWVSLLAFVVPGVTDSQRWYCFELCWLLMTGTAPRERVTAEMLILQALATGGRLLTPPPLVKSVSFGVEEKEGVE